jgi:hypothetical protein
LYLFWWTTRIQTIFFIVKNTSIHGQKVLNPLFFGRQIVFLLSTHFFIQFTQSAMFEKNSEFRLPTFQINFINHRSDLPTLLSTFSKISQNFRRHYPVFYMHTITCSFQAEEQ